MWTTTDLTLHNQASIYRGRSAFGPVFLLPKIEKYLPLEVLWTINQSPTTNGTAITVGVSNVEYHTRLDTAPDEYKSGYLTIMVK